jgi:glutathione S-transferase
VPFGLGWLALAALRGERRRRRDVLQAAAPALDTSNPTVRSSHTRTHARIMPAFSSSRALFSLSSLTPAAQAVRAGLQALLQSYEDMLPSDASASAGGAYLCGTGAVSAADVAVYAMLQRLVGTSGDAAFAPCLPDALQELPRLRAWFARMEAQFPVRFKGRERPAGAPPPRALA